MNPRSRSSRAFAPSALAVAATLALLSSGVQAFELDTGNPDLAIRWDNNVRLNFAAIASKGAIPRSATRPCPTKALTALTRVTAVAKRFDLLSEFDVVFKKRYGARISGTAWYDAAYGDTSRSNPNPPLSAIPSYINNQYSSTTKRLYHGGTGELMDAFVFGGVDMGEVPVQAKLGRHTIYWGESVLLGGHLHSVSYAQNPLDLQKGFATPGTEAKELFRPLNQLSAQAQVTDTLSVAGSTCSSGSPLATPRAAPTSVRWTSSSMARIASSSAGARLRRPRRRRRAQAAWRIWPVRPLGPAVARRHDGLLLSQLRRQVAAGLADAGRRPARAYNLIYADNIQLLGMSLGKNVGGVSIGAEVSTRHNTPLNATVLGVAPGLPAQGDTKGPRGDTWHGVVNALGTIAKTPVFDSATWLAELNFATGPRCAVARTCSWPKALRLACNGRTVATSGTVVPPRTMPVWAPPSRPPGTRCSTGSTCRRR